MSRFQLHHVLIAVDNLERARQFYTNVLEMEEINRPAFDYPGIWYKIGDGRQELHILVRSDATQRRGKWIDFDDIHFALRVESYRDTLRWLSEKGFRDDLPDDDIWKMKLRSKAVAGYAQIYIVDPDRNIIEFNCKTVD